MNFKFLLTLLTLFTLTYAVFSLKSYLNDNFIKRDTPLKEAVNRALNGEY